MNSVTRATNFAKWISEQEGDSHRITPTLKELTLNGERNKCSNRGELTT